MSAPNMKVSIQGFAGSFHDLVSQKLLPGRELITRATFPEVFHDVQTAGADYGIVAIENSIAGAILENFDRLKASGLKVIGEYYLRIEHNLIAMPGQSLADIKEVWSHPMAIKQCQDFLAKHPHLKTVEVADTAGAVADIMEQKLSGIAGIASSYAAEIYNAQIVQPNIETDKENYTRFLVAAQNAEHSLLSVQESAEALEYKCSIYVETGHQPGALLKVLQALNTFNVNMTMLVSRPIIGQAWSYGFYIDFTTATRDVAPVLDAVKLNAASVQLLGIYQSAK